MNYNMGSATRKLYHDMEDNINKKTNTLLSLHSFDEMSGNEFTSSNNNHSVGANKELLVCFCSNTDAAKRTCSVQGYRC